MLYVVRLSVLDEPFDHFHRKIRIVIMDFINRGAKLSILHDRIGKDARPSYDRTPGNSTRYPLDEFAVRPVDIAVRAGHTRLLVF